MTCRRIAADLDDYLDGALEAEAGRRLERHAAECRDCERLVERSRALRRVLAGLPIEGPGPGFLERALEAASSRSRLAAPKPTAEAPEPTAEAPKPTAEAPRRVTRGWYAAALAAGLSAVAIVTLFVNGVDPADPVQPSTGVAEVALAIADARTINLVFASDEALEGVSLTVDLPAGIELASYPGRDRVQWSTRLKPGKNVLPLELVAVGGPGGELVATMRRDGKEKVFRVSIAVATG